MIECKNGKCMMSGSKMELLGDLISIAQTAKKAFGDEADELVPMVVAAGMSGLFEGKEITEAEYFGEMA